MDEILLTDDEIHDEMDTLDGAWTFRDICRAQVVKVVEWMVKNDLRIVDTAQIARGYGVLLTKEAMQALKQAAEEGDDSAPPTPISYPAQTELGKRLVNLRNQAAGEGK